jgi:replicative DNA helicase
LGLEYFDDKAIDELADKFVEKDQYLSTGYTQLDNFLGGGFFQEGKALYTFGGETNVGKSIVVANFAVNALIQNKNVVIVTLEMSEYRYAKRITGMLTGIAISKLAENTKEFKELVFDFKGKNNNARLFIKEFPTKSCSAKSINGYLMKLQRQKNFKPDLIIVDYLSLLRPSINQGNSWTDLAFTSQEVRAISYLYGCPILSPLQLNRSSVGSSSVPGLDKIASSYDLLSNVDTHINVFQLDGDRDTNILRYVLKKARDGSKDDEGFWNIDYNTLRLFEGDANDLAKEDEMKDLFGGDDFDALMND